MTLHRRCSIGVLAAAVAALAAASPASATTVELADGDERSTLVITSPADGPANDMTVVMRLGDAPLFPPVGYGFDVTDDNAALTAVGPYCQQVTSGRVRCASWNTTHPSVEARLTDGDDSLTVHGPARVEATPGLIGGPAEIASLTVDAGPGDDSVRVRSGHVELAELRGGPGDDLVDLTPIYEAAQDDPREHDAGGHVEMSFIHGGEGDDTLVGGWAQDLLFGDAGDDVLDGREGEDQLTGGEGDDLLRAHDREIREDPRDCDFGVPCPPLVDQSLDCGPGTDEAVADPSDDWFGDCESVIVEPFAGGSWPE